MSLRTDSSPIFVDLDGTLIKTDLLYESILSLIKQSFWSLFLLPIWLLHGGKAYLKHQIAQRVTLRYDLLPYNSDFIAFLKQEKSKGRKLYLATASSKSFAENVADYLGFFDGVLASSEKHNLKGVSKVRAFRELTTKFSYAGNDVSDFAIFEQSEERFLVHPGWREKLLAKKVPLTKCWQRQENVFTQWFKALRLHQWLKNTLVFVPLFVTGTYTDWQNVLTAVIGFVCFGLLASATYILNDLLDLDSDRKHPRKKLRAFASGALVIRHGIYAQALLLVLTVWLATITSLYFQLALLAYLLFTVTYSLLLKNYVIADVIALAGLFTIRIIAGAFLIGVFPSFWLLAFSMFTFFSLALVKRCAEIKMLEKVNRTKTSGRDYHVEDFSVLSSMGTTSAFISILIMAFYVQNSFTDAAYTNPVILWLTLPAFTYWFCRIWLKTSRGEMHDDPIVFSLKDRGSVLTIMFICLLVVMAKV